MMQLMSAMSVSESEKYIVPGPRARACQWYSLLDSYAPPPAMSSETTTELPGLVHEWLRIDQVRVDGVLI
jgi:hypothetical protein